MEHLKIFIKSLRRWVQLIIKNGWIVQDWRRNIRDGALVIEGNRIIDVGPKEEIMRKHGGSGHDIIDATGKVVIPGLINSHTHISMTLLRGYADDLLLQEWLEKHIWPYERLLTDEDIELGALLGAVESIESGVTNVSSMYHYHPMKNEATALLKIGLRGTIGIAIFTWDPEGSLNNFKDAVKRYHGKNGLIRIASCPHAPYTVDPDLWRESEELRRELNKLYSDRGRIIITSHIAEDWREVDLVRERFNVDIPDGSIMKYLDGLGVLSSDFLAAHAIHLTDLDIEIMKKYDVKIAHNPVANMKLGMGYADTPRLLNEGLKVSLGTDGPASNNTLDLIETMKFAALINKTLKRDPTVTSAREVFKMATYYGAINLGYKDLGIIDKGYLADIVLVDFQKPHLTPVYDVYSHLVYAAKSSDVDTVIIDGKIVYEDKRFIGVDVEDIREKVIKRSMELAEKARGG